MKYRVIKSTQSFHQIGAIGEQIPIPSCDNPIVLQFAEGPYSRDAFFIDQVELVPEDTPISNVYPQYRSPAGIDKEYPDWRLLA